MLRSQFPLKPEIRLGLVQEGGGALLDALGVSEVGLPFRSCDRTEKLAALHGVARRDNELLKAALNLGTDDGLVGRDESRQHEMRAAKTQNQGDCTDHCDGSDQNNGTLLGHGNKNA